MSLSGRRTAGTPARLGERALGALPHIANALAYHRQQPFFSHALLPATVILIPSIHQLTGSINVGNL
jgi:hypothetical protein